MHWISELFQEGDEVVFKGYRNGHEHWGFVPGITYTVTRHPARETLGFFGKIKNGAQANMSPISNYDNSFMFELIPYNLENE
jgi:hypothetical protein